MARTGRSMERHRSVSRNTDSHQPSAPVGSPRHARQQSDKGRGGANRPGRCAGRLPDEHSCPSSGGAGAAFLLDARPSACGVVCAALHAEGHQDGSKGILAGRKETGACFLAAWGFSLAAWGFFLTAWGSSLAAWGFSLAAWGFSLAAWGFFCCPECHSGGAKRREPQAAAHSFRLVRADGH